MPKSDDRPDPILIWLGDAKAETNSPTGLQAEEANPEEFYDE
jgi:hypothetical protein